MKNYLGNCLLFIGIISLGVSHSIAAELQNAGTLTFIYDKDEGQCTMAVADNYQMEIWHDGKPPQQACKGHSVRSIKFNNVRSAVSVWLGSHFDQWNHAVGCSGLDDPSKKPNNFLFELRTLKNNPSSEPIPLDTIAAKYVGFPIIPGVLVKSRMVNKEDEINRELSCVRIKFD